jgi:hypothetical protein
VINFDSRDLAGMERWAKAEITKGAKAGMLSAALRCVSIITTEIIPSIAMPPVFDGFYRAGWRAEPTDQGADIVNTVPYASVIEYGARAENIKVGRKMLDALTEWVKRKGLAGNTRGSGISERIKAAKTSEEKQALEVEARQIAWAIAQSMRKRGIFNREGRSGLQVGQKALAKAQRFVAHEMAREIRRALGGGA